MSRITIDVTGEQHQQVKAMAAMQGKTMKEFVMERLFADEWTEDEKAAMEELKNLLAPRIKEAEEGKFVHKSFTEIAEEKLAEMGAK